MHQVIKSEYDGRLLLSYLKTELHLSSRLLSRLKRTDDGIMVNGQRVTVRYILHEGDILELADGDLQSNGTVLPTELPIFVLFEDTKTSPFLTRYLSYLPSFFITCNESISNEPFCISPTDINLYTSSPSSTIAFSSIVDAGI